MIGGDIGGGKTSMLNAVSLFIRPTLKIVSIEDTQEIRLPHKNWEMMVTRQGLGTGAGAMGEAGIGSISMFDLLRAALRQRPDFIIVGEITRRRSLRTIPSYGHWTLRLNNDTR